MSTKINSYSEESVKKKKSNVSVKIIIFLILLLTVASGIFYFYYQNTQSKIIEYNKELQGIKNLQFEQDRCSTTLSQESGNFGDYEYCLRLLQVFPK